MRPLNQLYVRPSLIITIREGFFSFFTAKHGCIKGWTFCRKGEIGFGEYDK